MSGSDAGAIDPEALATTKGFRTAVDSRRLERVLRDTLLAMDSEECSAGETHGSIARVIIETIIWALLSGSVWLLLAVLT